MVAMWSTGMEVGRFNRTNAYISHYTGCAWDNQVASSAGVSGNMYTMSRAGITSLSPFMVNDATANLTGIEGIGNRQAVISLYPNPASNTLHLVIEVNIENAVIYYMSGKYFQSSSITNSLIDITGLPSGVYNLHFTGKNIDFARQFVKQ